MITAMSAGPNGAWLSTSGHKYIAVGSTNLDTLTATHTSTTLTVTSYVNGSNVFKISGSQNSQIVVPNVGSQTGNAWSSTHTTTPTYPFVTLSYDANGGSGAPSSHSVLKGGASKISTTVPTRAGYTFSKWNTKADGTGTNVTSGGNVTVSANTTLYAIWTTNAYPVNISADEGITITFDGDDYSNVTTTVNKAYGSVCAYSIVANTGFLLKSRDPATDGSMTIGTSNPSLSATSQRVGCHLDDGENWVQACIYYDDGEEWHMVQAYYDNGEEWSLVY